MNEISVRKATVEDLDVLLAFEQGIVTNERPFDETLKEAEIHYYDLAEMITAPHIAVVVAESGNEIIGSGYARIEVAKAYQRHSEYAYLGCMYVKPEYRGKGVNNLVLEGLKEWCHERGIRELRLEVYTENLPALKAYEKAGFKPLLTWMRLGLDE